MLSAKEVNVHFLVPNSNPESVSDEIKKTFQDCIEAGLKPQFISDVEVRELGQKNNVIVIEKFEGEVFKFLTKHKCIVCGPKCLQICLAEKLPIPDTKSPVFITAMRDLVVSASNISSQLKSKIKEKVLYMGGKYTYNLVESVTHLVTGGVQSMKYNKAAEKGLPIMTIEWVDAVWNEGIKRNVHATNSQFNKYKCPVFLDLVITVSNMPQSEREKIKRTINSNGGTYCKEMKQNETSILIISNIKNSQKFNFAQLWQIPCVSPSWIYESVEKGYALPVDDYVIKPTVHCSTPTKDIVERPSFGASDISVLSGTHLTNQSEANFTMLSNEASSKLKTGPASQNKASKENNSHKKDIDNLDVREAKRVGAFLEGCKVYLSGFKNEEHDKLKRILTLGGAVVFMELSDAVSHVICGEFVAADMKAINRTSNRPFLVTVEWLVASLNHKTAAPEEIYIKQFSKGAVPDPEPPSPLSQKGMKLLRKNETQSPNQSKQLPKESSPERSVAPVVNRKLFPECQDESRDSNEDKKEATSVLENVNQESTIGAPIFKDLAFQILEFEGNIVENIESIINENGGTVVSQNFRGMTDYIIVPLEGADHFQLQSQVVTHIWLEDCIDEEKLLPVTYYHEPIFISPGCAPLKDCVITITTYVKKERLFLIMLVEALGATCQDTFSRRNIEEKGVKACTHLVSPSSGSSKYNAALKWNIPVVNKDWLLNCARLGTKTPETPYAVPNDGQKDVITTPAANSNCQIKNTPLPKECKKSSFPSVNTADTPKAPKMSVHSSPTRSEQRDLEPHSEASHGQPVKGNNEKMKDSSNAEVTIQATSFARLEQDEPPLPSTSFKTPLPTPTRAPSYGLNPKSKKSLEVTPTPSETSTPDTPYENIFPFSIDRKQARKQVKNNIDQFSQGGSQCSPKKRKISMPLSTLVKRAFEKFGPTPETSMVETGIDSGEEGTTRVTNSSKDSGKISSGSEFLDVLNEKLINLTPACQEVKRWVPDKSDRIALTRKSSESKLQVSKGCTSWDCESQPIDVGWQEPVEEREKARELEMIKDRKFAFSNVDIAKKEKLEVIIQNLGGTLIKTETYNSEITHLLTDRPKRSEKLLCSIAAGHYILHPSYLDESHRTGHFLAEDHFEWGNDLAKDNLPELTADNENLLAKAAFRWRLKISSSKIKIGAYERMKAIIFTSSNRMYENLCRLIIAGRGEVLGRKEDLNATHCFIDPKCDGQVNVKRCAAKNIYCLRPVNLGDLLVTDPQPKCESLICEEYKKYYLT